MSKSRRRSLLLLACLIAPVAGLYAADRDLASFQLGINTHRLLQEDRILLQGLGHISTRSNIIWEEVSDNQGRVQRDRRAFGLVLRAPAFIVDPIITLIYGHPAHDHGKRPVSASATTAFAAFGGGAAAELQSRARLFEVWNEWNGTKEDGALLAQGKPVEYVRLLAQVNHQIKEAAPEARILGGGISGNGVTDQWLAPALQAGLLQHCDALSFHPYIYFNPNLEERLPEIGLVRQVREVENAVRPYERPGRETPFYLTELGWPTLEGAGVTPAEQARYLARSVLLLAVQPRIRGVWLYELRDGLGARDDREQNFGLTLNDGTPKPAYAMVRDLSQLLHVSRSVSELENGSGGKVRTLRFQLHNGGEAWVFWALRPEERWRVKFAGETSAAPEARWRVLGEAGLRGQTAPLVLAAGPDPVLVTARPGQGGLRLAGVERDR